MKINFDKEKLQDFIATTIVKFQNLKYRWVWVASFVVVILLFFFFIKGYFDSFHTSLYQSYIKTQSQKYEISQPEQSSEESEEVMANAPQEEVAEKVQEVDDIAEVQSDVDEEETPIIVEESVSQNELFTGSIAIPEKPSIAIIVPTLGLRLAHSQKIIKELPKEVAVSFSPYTKDLKLFMKEAHEHGHELLIDLPLEAENHRISEPGPLTLYTDYSEQRLKDMVNKMLVFDDILGIYVYQGQKFLESEDSLNKLLGILKEKRLFFINTPEDTKELVWRVARDKKLPYIRPSMVIDEPPTRQNIRRKLIQAERFAEKKGYTCIVINGFPLALQMLKEWIDRLPAKGIQLIPLSSLFKKND